MAFDDTPTLLFPNATNGTNQLILNTATHASPSLPEVTTTEANVTTGDLRKIAYGISEQMYQYYNDTVVADRPNRFTMFKSVSVDPTTGLQTVSYTAQFITEVTGTEVTAEA